VRRQLAGALRGRVRGNGLAHRVVLGEGDLLIVAVHRRGGAVDERVDGELLGHLQHRLGVADIGLFVRHRRLDRWAHAGPGREVHDGVHAPGVQDGVRIADVGLDKRESLPRKVFDPLLLHGAQVEGIEVVDGRDAVAVVKEAAAEVPSAEADVDGI